MSICDQGSQRGPFDLGGVITYLRTKDSARVHVWREGLEHWALPQDVPELAGSLQQEPPRRDALPMRSDIIIEPRQFDQNIPTKKSKFSWGKIGALIGLALCLTDLIFEWRGPKFEGWDSPSGLG
jgi:hypothetical protein